MKKVIFIAECKCRGKKMSSQISSNNDIECLSCKKTWKRPKSASTNLMSFDQESYTPGELKEYPKKLWVIESSLEPPYPSISSKLRKEPNIMEIPTRPKGGRGANPWSEGLPKSVKSTIKEKLNSFDYSNYSSFAIPDSIGDGELKEADINWIYETIESSLPIKG